MAAPEGGEGPVVIAQTRGCQHHEPVPDCQDCGACCREAFDTVPFDDADATAGHPPRPWRRVHDDGWREVARVPSPGWPGRTRCAALVGDGVTQRFACVIYADRPAACRDLEAGSANCLFARQRVGYSPAPSSTT